MILRALILAAILATPAAAQQCYINQYGQRVCTPAATFYTVPRYRVLQQRVLAFPPASQPLPVAAVRGTQRRPVFRLFDRIFLRFALR